MGPYLLQQVPPFFGGKRFDQVLLGCDQNALGTHDKEISEQAGMDQEDFNNDSACLMQPSNSSSYCSAT